MNKVLGKIKDWCKDNLLILLYFLFAVVIEMTAVFVVEGTPFLSRPFLSLGLLLFVCGVLLCVKGNRARTIACVVMLLLQAVLDLVFSVIFDMTDQYFDFGMLNLRNDAFAILENIPIDFITFYVGLGCCVMFLIFGLRLSYYRAKPKQTKKSPFFYGGLMLAGIATIGVSFVTYYPRTSKDKYDDMIDGKTASAYSSYGMIGNLLGEVGNALFQDDTKLDEEAINDYIYNNVSTPTPYFGVSKGKNVITILGESLEWYTFLLGESEEASALNGEYPNALKITKEDLAFLYPNLTEFYNESVVMTNFHGREKTDIAETISILGSYPTGAYINYEYAENTIPQTLPNILKSQAGYTYLRSYHNGFKSFYNREEAHPMFGFEEGNPIDMYYMEEQSNKLEAEGHPEIFHNYMDEGERNLDSEMITTAKDLMFPTDGKFYTYITTITMHGMYYDRANLRKENNTKLYDQIATLEKYKPDPLDESIENFVNVESLYYYMTTGLEFDYMLGCMKEELISRGLWENTVIVLFGDHNAYYQELSNFVKGIDKNDETTKFTDLYNVPLMIRDKGLVDKLKENNQSRIIDKFTCTADIVPTLLDMLGIKYFENMYYGHSVFDTRQSVLYSRAYDIFLSDGILRRSVTGDMYTYAGVNERGVPVKDTLPAFETEGKKLVEKIKHCDYIFKQDHFGKVENYTLFRQKMNSINQ